MLQQLPRPLMGSLPAPSFNLTRDQLNNQRKVAMAVESMRQHMTNEGWELMLALEEGGFTLAGHNIPVPSNVIGKNLLGGLTDVRDILDLHNPAVVVVQDKREWEGLTADKSRDSAMRFRHIDVLKDRNDIFKLTILKDAHQQPDYHREAAEEMGCHAWIVYYHPSIVAHLAPFVRPQHVIRTWHSIDPTIVPPFYMVNNRNPLERRGCFLSGAVSNAYPLRRRLFANHGQLPDCTVLAHPGYHRKGCQTPEYLMKLSQHKVAICTSSIYGYALRKVVEATACGCIVLTDLPIDEVMPGDIDDNLVRITPDFSASRVGNIVRELIASWNPERQHEFAKRAIQFYDWRALGRRLVDDIESHRRSYCNERS